MLDALANILEMEQDNGVRQASMSSSVISEESQAHDYF